MAVIEYQGTQVELDEEGFLAEESSWNENVAAAIAMNEGIDCITDEMMSVIMFMRKYYQDFKSFPLLSAVCRNVHQPGNCVKEEFIDPLTAWKIAGLPKPNEEVLAYLQPPREII